MIRTLVLIFIYLTIFCSIKSSRISPDDLEDQERKAEIVEINSCFSSCLYFCGPQSLLTTIESEEESIEESNAYRVFHTPAHSMSLETLGLLHGTEDNLWKYPESRRFEASQNSRASTKFYPLLKDIEAQMEKLENDHKDNREHHENSAKGIISDELLLKVASYLKENDLRNFRLVSKKFHRIQEKSALKSLGMKVSIENIADFSGFEANMFLSHFEGEGSIIDRLLQMLKRGEKWKSLLLLEICLKLKLLNFEDIFDDFEDAILEFYG